ncbi:electron transport complex, RnfABCDGE type, G subunit [Denitrovibrio acetiphilus DSM 12809]|uniref:Ion-translocating oxidoreductase complex subunit G n=1 Tax=Denitrovibrio acetiphilus (strain DSM 12809 / NBRC 114555 / N2460) TaxID=522772 RepID=D4H114_DENA2|nr:RnfABCDGE type electron transport complex subunit G [Denitrovibrio acetiphilus]ADD68677.1 electron transport complex, RnfABCDGE type, G subunit [Denitrovibrio acetiphilus DSM 12809]
MKNSPINMVIVLTIITAISSVILAGVYAGTKDKIAEEYRKDFLKGLKVVLPGFNNEPDIDFKEMDGKKVYVGRRDGEVFGYAVQSTSPKGYSGDITVLVGVAPKGDILGIEILKHAETPGLGNKIEDLQWKSSFVGLDQDSNISVRKDGGEIDEFSGATISPRAVCEAVNSALDFLGRYVVEGE